MPLAIIRKLASKLLNNVAAVVCTFNLFISSAVVVGVVISKTLYDLSFGICLFCKFVVKLFATRIYS